MSTAAGIGGLIEPEGKLHVSRTKFLRNRQLAGAGLGIAGLVLQVLLGIPEGSPGAAAVGAGLYRQADGAIEQGIAAKGIVKPQSRRLARQIDCRGNQVFILLRAGTQGAEAGLAPVLVLILVKVHPGHLSGVQVCLLAGVPGEAGVGGLQAPAVAGEAVPFKVILKEHLLSPGVLRRKGSGDGVIHAYPLEGIIRNGAHVYTVHGDGGNPVALVRGYGNGLAVALFHQHPALRRNRTVLTGAGRNGCVVLHQVGINDHIVNGNHGAVLALVDKGELDMGAVLELLRDRHLGLGIGPVGKDANVPQVPQLLPGLAAVHRGHDQKVAALVMRGKSIDCIEIKNEMGLSLLPADVQYGGDEPLILFKIFIVAAGGHVFLIPVPGLYRLPPGLNSPAIRQPGAVKVLLPQDIRGHHLGVVVAVACGLQGVGFGVAGIVMDHQADALTHAGDIQILQNRRRAGRRFRHANHIKFLAVLGIRQDHSRHILVVRQGQRGIVPALRFPDGHLLDLRLLRINGNGELPGAALIVRLVLIINQLGFHPHSGLGIVGETGARGIRTIPGVKGVVVVDPCRNHLEIVIVIDTFGFVFHVLSVIHRAIRAGDGVAQVPGRAQHTSVHIGQGIHKIVMVR